MTMRPSPDAKVSGSGSGLLAGGMSHTTRSPAAEGSGAVVAEMHRRAETLGDLAQQRRLAHAGGRLQDDDLFRAAEDGIDQASRGKVA